MIKIIGGKAKGIILDVPKGQSVRPTGVRARKSLFDSYRDWEGKTFVDLFAGAGGVGLEAASRGAANIYFVEKVAKNCKLIQKNIEKVAKAGVEANMEVICSDAAKAHKRLPALKNKIDIIFADPPYDMASDVLKVILEDKEFAEWASGALFIIEVATETSRKPVFADFDLWKMESQRKLGQSLFLIFHANIKCIVN